MRKRYPSRESTLAILLSSSAHSAAGSEPATIPAPANRVMACAVMRALRMATENSEVSRLSMPQAPAYQPRS